MEEFSHMRDVMAMMMRSGQAKDAVVSNGLANVLRTSPFSYVRALAELEATRGLPASLYEYSVKALSYYREMAVSGRVVDEDDNLVATEVSDVAS